MFIKQLMLNLGTVGPEEQPKQQLFLSNAKFVEEKTLHT